MRWKTVFQREKVSQEKQSGTNEPMGDEFFDLNSEKQELDDQHQIKKFSRYLHCSHIRKRTYICKLTEKRMRTTRWRRLSAEIENSKTCWKLIRYR